MAADQWKKRLNSASVVACHGREQHRAKRKNTGSSQFDSNMKSHISLEWDGNQKRVIARKEQVGISWRDVKPIMASSPSVNNIAADVFAVPHEIYGLENLRDVLSYEVWESLLSENQKNHLMQLLPRGSETEQVLQSLLSGDNFHFGNPFLNWGSSVCSGELHPDSIRQQDQRLKAEKKAYYAELHNYHNKMIDDLLKMKERFEHCKDPEEEFTQKTLRVSKRGSLKDNSGNPPGDVNLGAKTRKGDERHQQNICCNDGAEYMSYVKISKKQHEIVKNMKQSGKSIQSRSLNQVLGNIDSFNIQPYEVFVKEEQKKLRDHWIKLATEALPAACANWRDLNLRRQQLRKSLEQDIKDRLRNLIEDVENSDSHNTLQDQTTETVIDDHNVVLQDQIENGVEGHLSSPEGEEESLSGSPQGETREDFSPEEETESMDTDPEKQTIAKSDDATLNASAEYSGDASGGGGGGDAEIGEEVADLSGGDVWPTGNISHSYFDSATSHDYVPDDAELTIAPPKVNDEQLTHLVDLEPNLHVGDSGRDAVHRQADDGSFGSYSNQDRNELFQIQSLFKGDEMLMYPHHPHHHHHHHEPNHMLMEDGHFPGNMLHQPLPMDQGHKRENEAYLHRNITDNVYSDGGRFLIPRQEGLSGGVDVQDWVVRMPPPPPMQSHLNGELTNWFAGEHQVGGNQSIGGGTSRNGGDQSLYSVLSQCNQLRTSGPYQAAEQFVASRNYGGVVVGPTNASIGNVAAQGPLEYMSGTARDAAEDMGWIPPRQNSSGLHDPPYLRSWNQ